MESRAMTILLHLLPVQKCSGCGDITSRVEAKTLLCLACYHPWLKAQEKKAKLDSTLSLKFAMPIAKIQEFRALFQK
jgi:hypothetical protein